MTIETKELVISEELKRKVEMICRFAYVDYNVLNKFTIYATYLSYNISLKCAKNSFLYKI